MLAPIKPVMGRCSREMMAEKSAIIEIQWLTVRFDNRGYWQEAGIGVLKFEASYLSKQNKNLPCFNLPRRECDLVISGYSVKYRLAIIDRWHLQKRVFRITIFRESAEIGERKFASVYKGGNGDPLFVAKDVAVALGYSNP